MKAVLFSVFSVAVMSSPAFADFNLAHNGDVVVCAMEDYSIVLNAKRTTMREEVEGEAATKKITKTDTDGDTFVSYTSEWGTLNLDDQGDTFTFFGDDEATPVKCQ
jgi:hypothetical protein